MNPDAFFGNKLLLKANVTRCAMPGLLHFEVPAPGPPAQGGPLPSPHWFSLQLICLLKKHQLSTHHVPGMAPCAGETVMDKTAVILALTEVIV